MPAFWFKLAIKIAFGTIYISKLLKPQSGKFEFRTIAAVISSNDCIELNYRNQIIVGSIGSALELETNLREVWSFTIKEKGLLLVGSAYTT